jgi:hypothetical protein
MQIEHYSITQVSLDMTSVMQESVNLIRISYKDGTFLQNDIENLRKFKNVLFSVDFKSLMRNQLLLKTNRGITGPKTFFVTGPKKVSENIFST